MPIFAGLMFVGAVGLIVGFWLGKRYGADEAHAAVMDVLSDPRMNRE